MAELGGLNLYSFVYNNPIGWWDYLGNSCIGDALELLSDPAGFLEGKIMDRITGKFPPLVAAAIAAELGKALGDSANAALQDVNKLLKDKGFDAKVLCCVESYLNDLEKSISTLDLNKMEDQGLLADALIECDCDGVRAVQGAAIKGMIDGIAAGAKEFAIDKILGEATSALKGKLGSIDGMEHNPIVKDAMEFALEEAKKALGQKLKCSKDGKCDSK